MLCVTFNYEDITATWLPWKLRLYREVILREKVMPFCPIILRKVCIISFLYCLWERWKYPFKFCLFSIHIIHVHPEFAVGEKKTAGCNMSHSTQLSSFFLLIKHMFNFLLKVVVQFWSNVPHMYLTHIRISLYPITGKKLHYFNWVVTWWPTCWSAFREYVTKKHHKIKLYCFTIYIHNLFSYSLEDLGTDGKIILEWILGK